MATGSRFMVTCLQAERGYRGLWVVDATFWDELRGTGNLHYTPGRVAVLVRTQVHINLQPRTRMETIITRPPFS